VGRCCGLDGGGGCDANSDLSNIRGWAWHSHIMNQVSGICIAPVMRIDTPLHSVKTEAPTPQVPLLKRWGSNRVSAYTHLQTDAALLIFHLQPDQGGQIRSVRRGVTLTATNCGVGMGYIRSQRTPRDDGKVQACMLKSTLLAAGCETIACSSPSHILPPRLPKPHAHAPEGEAGEDAAGDWVPGGPAPTCSTWASSRVPSVRYGNTGASGAPSSVSPGGLVALVRAMDASTCQEPQPSQDMYTLQINATRPGRTWQGGQRYSTAYVVCMQWQGGRSYGAGVYTTAHYADSGGQSGAPFQSLESPTCALLVT
jgi:hypothetical protein